MADQRRSEGVRIVGVDEFDANTAQTAGMHREAAITAALAGASKIWAGVVTIEPDARTGAHHHGALESVIYVVRGLARMRWGDHLEFVAEAGAGEFSMCHRSCRTRKSTAARPTTCTASSCAATRSRSS